MKFLQHIILLISVALPVNALLAETVVEDPLQRRAHDIGMKLRCTVCQNQPVAESNSDLAKIMMSAIKEKVAEGKSEQQIMDFFVERYGDFVLLKPRKQGIGLPLWMIPPVLLLFIGSVAFLFLRTRTLRVPSRPKTLSDTDRARVRQERENNN